MTDTNFGIRISANAQGVSETFAGVGRSASQSAAEVKKAAEDYVRSLKDEANTLGMTALQVKAYRGEQMQLSEAQKQAAVESIKRIRQYQEEQTALASLQQTTITYGKALALSAIGYATGLALQVKHQIDAAASMQTLSEKTGVGVGELTRLKYAADVSDTSIDTLARSMKQLPKSIVEAQNPNSQAGRGFAFLQIDPATIKNTQQGFEMIADAITRVEDPMAKSAALQMILKRSGEELIPFFNNGAAGLRRLADEGGRWAEISGITAERAKELKDQMVTLQYAQGAFSKQLAADLVGPLNNWIAQLILARREAGGFAGALALLATQTPFAKNSADQVAGYTKELAELEASRPRYTERGYDTTFVDNAIARTKSRLEIAKLVLRQEEEALNRGKERPADTAAAGGKIKGTVDGSGASAARERISEVEKLSQALQRQADMLGMTSAEQLRYNVIQSGATGAAREALLVQVRRIDAYNVEKAAQEQIKHVEQERVRLQAANDESYTKNIESIAKQTEHTRAATEQLRKSNQEIGLTTDQLRDLRIARAQDTVTMREAAATEAASEPGRERELQLLRDLALAERERSIEIRRGAQAEADAERSDALAKAAKDAEAENKRRVDNIERDLTGSLMRGFERAETPARAYFNTLKNMAKTTILEPLLKPIVAPFAQAVANATSGGGGLSGLFKGLFGGSDNSNTSTTGDFPAVDTMVAHTGRGPGESPASRSVVTSIFAGAPRFHSGIGPGEMPAIIQPSESVLTQGQMRALGGALNGGQTTVNAPFNLSIDARGSAPGVEAQIAQTMNRLMPGMLYEHRRKLSGLIAAQQRERKRA